MNRSRRDRRGVMCVSPLSRSAQHNITAAIPAGIGKCVRALILGCRCAQPQATGYDPYRDQEAPYRDQEAHRMEGAQPASTVTTADETPLAWEGVEFTPERCSSCVSQITSHCSDPGGITARSPGSSAATPRDWGSLHEPIPEGSQRGRVCFPAQLIGPTQHHCCDPCRDREMCASLDPGVSLRSTPGYGL